MGIGHSTARPPRPGSEHSSANRASKLLSVLALTLAGCSAATDVPPTQPEPPVSAVPAVAPVSPPAPNARAAVTTVGGERAPVVGSVRPRPVVLPADEAAHNDALEWWYYNGHLIDEAGTRFGFHFVIFQAVGDDGATGYMAHAGLSDLTAGTHEQAGRYSFGDQPAQPTDGFALTVADWTLASEPDGHALTSTIGDMSLELDLSPVKPAVLHDEDGYLEGPEGWTYYYSWTRMEVTGTWSRLDQTLRVTGTAWMDHQWGDFAVTGFPFGWQWFAVQLDDGSELMVTEARDGASPPSAYGTLVQPDGASVFLEQGAIALTTGDTWTSPHTGAEYPAEWRMALRDYRIELELTPSIADSEMTVAFPPRTIYWEGVVDVRAMVDGDPVGGRGFVELVGYVGAGND